MSFIKYSNLLKYKLNFNIKTKCSALMISVLNSLNKSLFVIESILNAFGVYIYLLYIYIYIYIFFHSFCHRSWKRLFPLARPNFMIC